MTVVMLAAPGDSTWIVANALQEHFGLSAVILENPIPGWQLAQRRAARQGWLTVIGQIGFVGFSRLLRHRSHKRAQEIIAANGLKIEQPPNVSVVHVESANDRGTIDLLKTMAPRVVIVNGTRILSKELLSAIDAIFINVHAGITPKYRGVHGAYWAQVAGDTEHIGVTVHLVDPGIDSGGVLYQARCTPTKQDNFCTYPFLQLAAGLPLLIRAVEDALNGRLQSVDPKLPSKLYYHPTLWQYAWYRITRRVR